jgi:predicted metal-dependent hydrolase
MSFDPRFYEGIETFNRQQFFKAHQIWESVWMHYRGESRDLLKGMIQIALGLHHFTDGNTRGARKLYNSCQKYIGSYSPQHLGVDVERFLNDIHACCAELAACPDETPATKLNPNLVPRIHCEAPQC